MLTKVEIILTQRSRHIDGEVGQNAIAASAFERQQTFHHGAVAVDPAILSGSFDHRVFA